MPSPRELTLYILLVTMELMAGFAVIVGSSLLDGVSLQYALFWVMLLSGIVGLAVSLMVMRVGPGEPWNRIILLAGAALGAVAPAVIVSHTRVSIIISAFFLLIAYWRGIAVTEEVPTHRAVLSRFGFGLALLFLGLVWVVARGIDRESSIWHMMAFLGIGYTVITLIALGTARVEHAREPGAGPAVLLAVVAQLGVIVLLGLLALEIFSVDVAGAIYTPTRPFWDALGTSMYHVVQLLTAPIEWFINLLRPSGRARAPSGLQPPPPPTSSGRKPKAGHPVGNPIVSVVAFSIAVLILISVIYLIWRTLPRLPRRGPPAGYKEERRTLSPREMWQLFMVWLRRLFSRGVDAAGEVIRTSRRRVLGDLPDDPIRRAYTQLLRRAAVVGVQRPPGVTPEEFYAKLAARWPEGSRDFAGLTQAYVRRRYGELAFTEAQVSQVREQWGRARLVMRVQPRQRIEAPVISAPGIGAVMVPHRRRIHLPSVREFFKLPEPAGGTETPDWRKSVFVAVFSVVFPIVLVIVVLGLLAIISTRVNHKGHSLPSHTGPVRVAVVYRLPSRG